MTKIPNLKIFAAWLKSSGINCEKDKDSLYVLSDDCTGAQESQIHNMAKKSGYAVIWDFDGFFITRP
jgi:lipocalin